MTQPMDRNTQTASATAAAIGSVASNFMLDAGTYQAAAEAGYGGMDFYFAGRAGVLGDASGSEVSDAVWLFEPGAVAAAWAASAAVESRASSAQRFASAAAVWADAHLDPDALDYDRLAELAGAVVSAADATGAALFAGWRDLPEPDDARALALHRMNALRELRFARHRDALVDAGIEPLDAVMVRSPYMAGIFGWPEPHPDPAQDVRDRWTLAEAATDERFGRDLAVLSADEQAVFVTLCDALVAAVR